MAIVCQTQWALGQQAFGQQASSCFWRYAQCELGEGLQGAQQWRSMRPCLGGINHSGSHLPPYRVELYQVYYRLSASAWY